MTATNTSTSTVTDRARMSLPLAAIAAATLLLPTLVAGFQPHIIAAANTKHKLARERPGALRFRNDDFGNYGQVTEDDNDGSGWVTMIPRAPSVDTSAIAHHKYVLMDYFDNMNTVHRSEPQWIHTQKDGLLACSPSDIVERHIRNIVSSPKPNLIAFTDPQRAKFDFDWRYAFMRLVSSNHNNPDDFSWMLKRGESNSHPLRFQLIYIPPHTSLAKHVHASFEFNVPLIGKLYERRVVEKEACVPAGLLQRNLEHTIGSPLNEFSEVPTPEELNEISEYLSERVQESPITDDGMSAEAEERLVNAGDCLMNPIGSYHESYTKDEACLILAFGSNVHARPQKE